jgi:hypothetical protein
VLCRDVEQASKEDTLYSIKSPDSDAVIATLSVVFDSCLVELNTR